MLFTAHTHTENDHRHSNIIEEWHACVHRCVLCVCRSVYARAIVQRSRDMSQQNSRDEMTASMCVCVYCWQKAFLNSNSNPILCPDYPAQLGKKHHIVMWLVPYILVRRMVNAIPTTSTLGKLTSWACVYAMLESIRWQCRRWRHIFDKMRWETIKYWYLIWRSFSV